MKFRRVLLLLFLAADVLLVVLFWPILRGPHRHVDDRVDLIPKREEVHLNQYLDMVQRESGIEVRVVLAPDSRGTTPEQFALATMRDLGLGRESGGRGLLILYDTLDRAMRIEVGPKLEGILPDAFVGYLMREHLDAFFKSGNPEFGLRTTLFMIHWRIRRARLGEEYDPSFEEYLKDVRRVAAGGGATGRMSSGVAGAEVINRTGDTAAAAYFRPQPTVEAAYRLHEEWLARGGGQVDVPLFTPASTRYFQQWLPMSPAFAQYLLAGEYGRRYVIDQRAGLAMLYYTDDPFVSPKFFRRAPEGWQMDVVAEVANSQEAAGMEYTWRLRVSGDDFSQSFADMYALAPVRTSIVDFYRVAGGDNRTLAIRGSSKAVESELDPNRRAKPVSVIDGTPGVEYLSVRAAAERIRAARGTPTVVLLYDYRISRTPSQLADIVRLANTCRSRGIGFLAFHSAVLSPSPLPDTLRRYNAPFPAVQLYQWRRGMLHATMGELGIEVGMSWAAPLVAVLDREGEVVWQAQGVSDWSAAEQAAMGVAEEGASAK